MNRDEVEELISQHKALVQRRSNLIASRAAMTLEVVSVDVKLEKLHTRIKAALDNMPDPVEHIEIGDVPKF